MRSLKTEMDELTNEVSKWKNRIEVLETSIDVLKEYIREHIKKELKDKK